MGNMLDYLAWRGDLALSVDPLNEVDGLILSTLSYVNFDGVMPASGDMREQIPIAQACQRLIDEDPDATLFHQTGYLWEGNGKLIHALARCPRFAQAPMAGYMSELNREKETQFGAVAFPLDDCTVVAYRGTDDSLAGWKEDMNLSFESPVPAQLRACEYLERVAEAFSGPIRLYGHSKGGNLAVFAGARCARAVQDRILSVTSFDGPGQDETMVASAGYARVRDRLRLFVPHFSVIGMLLEHEDNYAIVASDGRSLMQHNAYSWQVLGRHYVLEAAPNPASVTANRVLRQWIAGMSAEDRRQFSDGVYNILSASQAHTLCDIADNWGDAALCMIRKLNEMKPEERGGLQRALGGLFEIACYNIWQPLNAFKGARARTNPETEKKT